MAAPESLVNEPHRGSFFHAGWELRITRRCLVEDFEVDPTTPFADLRSKEIIKAFISDRAVTPTGGKTVGPVAGEKTCYRLGYGDDHRGATWYDPVEKVVWLCAYHGQHRSGEADDSFPFFNRLIDEGRIKPTKDDYVALLEERAERFVDLVFKQAQELLDEARTAPGEEVSRVIGGEATVGLVVEVVETLNETHVAFFIQDLGSGDRFVLLLKAFFPEAQFADWELVDEFPTRELRVGEVCYRILH
jgi:hypothetical protein